MVCEMQACRTCTGCAHGKHGACRGEVTCPDDKQQRACACCGTTTPNPEET